MSVVPFNRATTAPAQVQYLTESFASGVLCGDGPFSQRASEYLSSRVGGGAVLLTPSCTDALEMAALLMGIQPGDEVIVPAFTFVSTANAFAMFGATLVFADSDPRTMNVDPVSAAALVTPRTRAIVLVHYGGVACDMDHFLALAAEHDLMLIEDNAHGLLGAWQGRPLGSFGAMATLSFHETKNFSCGEGGALVVNDPALLPRAEILREKGTNRNQFFRGEVDKYTWVDTGSSYLLADPLAAVLCAQFEDAERIQERRCGAWDRYHRELEHWAARFAVRRPVIAAACDHPAHLYWLWMPTPAMRAALIAHMRERGVHAVFHYQALNVSPMGESLGGRRGMCPVAEAASDQLVRLPLYSDMSADDVDLVIDAVLSFRGA